MKQAFCLLGVLLAAITARAAALPVSYLVDLRALKTSTPSGTPLTFTLYSDNACTRQVASQVVNVEDVNVIESLKRLTPRGATKAPQTARLTTTLSGISAPGSLFLTVSGPGITAVGASCQVQVGRAEEGILPSLHVTLRYGLGTGRGWAIDDPPFFGLYNPTHILASDRAVAFKLQALNTGIAYACDIEVVKNSDFEEQVISAEGANNILIYDLNCVAFPAHCSNDVVDPDETADDCGGPSCPGCRLGQVCNTGSDCMSGVCQAKSAIEGKWCVWGHCGNGVQDSGEAGVDCGSCNSETPWCGGCPAATACTSSCQCFSYNCSGGVCQ